VCHFYGDNILTKSIVNSALIEVQYLPPLSYFSALRGYQGVVVEKHEHYEKQTYRNRCYINSAQGREILIVPVTAKHGKTSTGEVRIDYGQKWLNNHWRTIQTAYGKAPFFEYYAEDLHDILFRKVDLLYDLNLALLTMCLKWLKWNMPIRETLAYDQNVGAGVTDLRSAITPKKSGSVGKFYKPAVYHQVFGNKFVENLSLIDLVFCEGPGAWDTIQASTV
jgi:hypothetical protein